VCVCVFEMPYCGATATVFEKTVSCSGRSVFKSHHFLFFFFWSLGDSLSNASAPSSFVVPAVSESKTSISANGLAVSPCTFSSHSARVASNLVLLCNNEQMKHNQTYQ
jgi:hypothetical protein